MMLQNTSPIFWTLTALAVLFAASPTLSRNSIESQMESLRADPRYLSATAIGSDLTLARERADKALISQIQISIGVTTTSKTETIEDNSGLQVTSDRLTEHRTFGGMPLKGLHYLDLQQGELWLAMAYVHRDSLTASMNSRRAQIVELTGQGIRLRGEGMLGDALSKFNRAWLLAQFYPGSIDMTKLEAGLAPDPKLAIEGLIEQCLAGLKIEALECYEDDGLVIAPLRVKFKEKPVKDLTISYYGGEGMEYARVLNGRADLPLTDRPVSPDMKLLITIEFAREFAASTDPELAGLYETFGSGDFSTLVPVSLRIPWLSRDGIAADLAATQAPMIQPAATVDSTPSGDEPIKVLGSLQTTPEFIEVLSQYAKLGKLSFGTRDEFAGSDDCYVAILGEAEVVAFLHFDGEEFHTQGDSEQFADLAGRYKGRRQVWIKSSDAR